jgi:tight adherence protein B
MDGMLLLIGLLVAATVALGVVHVYQRVSMTRVAVNARLAPEIGVTGLVPRSALRGASRSRLPLVDRLPLSLEARERMRAELEKAGDPLTVNEYLGLRAVGAGASGVIGLVLAGALGTPGWLAATLTLAFTPVGWWLPRAYVGGLRKRRENQIAGQLPEALTAIAKSLRAGTGLLQALDYAATETPAPLGTELQVTLRELQLGADAEDSFNRLAERVGNADLDIAITAIVIQRSVGGNLSEILANVTRTIRARVELQREIRVLTARQKLQGNLVSALPVVVAIVFVAFNPDVGKLLYNNNVGRISLGIGLGFEVFGLWLIRRMSIIEY